MLETPRQEIKLFYCYAREDKALLDELEKHLSTLKRQYHLTTWHDRAIPPGEVWEQEIDKQLSTANLVLLLISPDFMASDYCYSKEMSKALERERAGACRVIPILLRPTDWEGTPFSHLQMLPTGTRPVTSWPDRDEAFWDIALGIRMTLKGLMVVLGTKHGRLEEGGVLTQHQPNKHVLTNAPISTFEKQNPGVIDLSIEAALKIGADKRPVSLADLHDAYLQANPSITKGTTRNSFVAMIIYHTINMRSRFFYPNDKRRLAQWLSRPLFKRVARGRYMLLSPSEVTLFRRRVEEDDPRIYQDEYDVNDIKQPLENKDKKNDAGSANEKITLLERNESRAYLNINLRKFREAMVRHYSFDDLYILGVDVNKDFEGVPGDTMQMRAQMLIEYCKSNGTFDDLVTRVLEDYPDLVEDLGIQVLYENDE